MAAATVNMSAYANGQNQSGQSQNHTRLKHAGEAAFKGKVVRAATGAVNRKAEPKDPTSTWPLRSFGASHQPAGTDSMNLRSFAASQKAPAGTDRLSLTGEGFNLGVSGHQACVHSSEEKYVDLAKEQWKGGGQIAKMGGGGQIRDKSGPHGSNHANPLRTVGDVKMAAQARMKGGLSSLQATLDKLESDKRRDAERAARKHWHEISFLVKLGCMGQRPATASSAEKPSAGLASDDEEGRADEQGSGKTAESAEMEKTQTGPQTGPQTTVEVERILASRRKTKDIVLKEIFESFASGHSREGEGIMTQSDFRRFLKSQVGKRIHPQVDDDTVLKIWYEQQQLQEDMALAVGLTRAESAKGLCFKFFTTLLHKTCFMPD